MALSKRFLVVFLFAACLAGASLVEAGAEPGVTDGPASTGADPTNVDLPPELLGFAPALNSSTNLTYHGGSVMHTNTTYAIYWDPGSTMSSNYKSLISGFLQNVAADSGAVTNVYATTPQYTDGTGSAAYSSTFGGAYVDTNPFPSSGNCANYSYTVSRSPSVSATTSTCLTSTQLVAEIDSVIAAQGWPTGLGAVYFLFTPQNVGSCFGSTCAFGIAGTPGGSAPTTAPSPTAVGARCSTRTSPTPHRLPRAAAPASRRMVTMRT